MQTFKTASFFAGIGGIDKAFEEAGFPVIWANEIDDYAVKTYSRNFGVELVEDASNPKATCREGVLVHGDVHKIPVEGIPDFDILVGGFPCQAFSVAGYRKGFEDDRGNLFFELYRIFSEKKPKVVFLENVKNLVGHDKGNTFKVILEHLHKADYHVKFKVLNASEYGNIPQNRERIYIVGFLDEKAYEKFDFPMPVELTRNITDCIDFQSEKDERFYYTAKKCGFFKELEENIKTDKTLYQWRRVYVRENKSNLCPTLTANMGTGGHNVPLIKTEKGIRKLTPQECLAFMGFPKDFKLPEELALCHLYKQAGNSVVVPVVERIAEQIMKALKESS